MMGKRKKNFKKPADSDFLAVHQDSFIGDLVTQSVRDFLFTMTTITTMTTMTTITTMTTMTTVTAMTTIYI